MGHDQYAEHHTPSNSHIVVLNVRAPHVLRVRCFSFRLLLSFFFLIPAALAQNTIHIPADQPTIQAGINAAHNGDTVLVSPGTYYENINFKGKAITVISSDGPTKTIIDGGAKQGLATITFQSQESRSSVIADFTIQNGGIATPNSPEGGAYVTNAAPTILNNTITSNGCNGVTVNAGAALIQGNIIRNTQSNNYFYCSFQGSGLLLDGNGTVNGLTHSDVLGNTIENNTQGLCAGGIMISAAEGSLIQSNIIRNNASTSCSGGLPDQQYRRCIDSPESGLRQFCRQRFWDRRWHWHFCAEQWCIFFRNRRRKYYRWQYSPRLHL